MVERTNEASLDNLDVQETKIYEIGYLLAPFIAQDNLAEAVSKSIKSQIDAVGGVVTSEMDPSMIHLAYTIRKTIANKINKFNDAYFGAIRFKVVSGQAPVLKEKLDKEESIIRYLIISMDKGSETISVPRRAYHRREEKPFEIERIEKEVEDTELKPEMTKEDIDKEIESLLDEPTA